MERLTKKAWKRKNGRDDMSRYDIYYPNIPNGNFNADDSQRKSAEINRKLGHLEDLEEELGIPLEVLFKALKDGIIPKEHFEDDELIDNKENKLYKISLVVYKLQNTTEYYLSNIRYQYGDANCGIDSGCSVELKDYGKTWVLNSEELENV